MIGGIIFVIGFVLFLLISFVVPLPPGATIVQEFIPDAIGTSYEGVVSGIINGVIYGVIIWLIFTIAKMLYDRMQSPKEVMVKVQSSTESREPCLFSPVSVCVSSRLRREESSIWRMVSVSSGESFSIWSMEVFWVS